MAKDTSSNEERLRGAADDSIVEDSDFEDADDLDEEDEDSEVSF